jgi:hypothetical protein
VFQWGRIGLDSERDAGAKSSTKAYSHFEERKHYGAVATRRRTIVGDTE